MRRTLLLAGVFLAGTVLSAVVSATIVGAGSPQSFDDVPPGHPFFTEIESVANDCITGGYPDGGFHPADPVTRQAMAAFLHRSASRVIQGSAVGEDYPDIPAASTAWTDWVELATVTVSVPELPGSCSVPVHVTGMASVFTNWVQAVACNSSVSCNIEVGLAKDGTTVEAAFGRVTSDHWGASFSPTHVFSQPDGTTATYTLRVRGFDTKANTVHAHEDRTIVATTHPSEAFTVK